MVIFPVTVVDEDTVEPPLLEVVHRLNWQLDLLGVGRLPMVGLLYCAYSVNGALAV